MSKYYFWTKKYWVGYKTLLNAFKLANGFILQTSFIDDDFKKQKQRFLRQLRRLVCSNPLCKVKYTSRRLRVCNGCMDSAYCSVECQKMHWNGGHSAECGEWERTPCAWSDVRSRDGRSTKPIEFETANKFADFQFNGECEEHKEDNEQCARCRECFDGAMVHIADPTRDLDILRNSTQIVASNRATQQIGYPLRKTYLFEIKRRKPISRRQFVKIICNLYRRIYDEEDETAAVKYQWNNLLDPSFQERKVVLLNRHHTNGRYGIWGHSIGDLGLDRINDEGDDMYSLCISS